MRPTPAEPILLMKNIHVSYGDQKALKGVDFDLYRGEIHALVGEHRAGKSSLVKILSGAERKNEGEIFYRGKKHEYFTPRTATINKIGMVYQDLNIIPHLNSIENIFLGQMKKKWSGILESNKMKKDSSILLNNLSMEIDLEAPLYNLTVGQQHMIELARIMMMDPDIMILDELSNKLTIDEIKNIYKILFKYKKENKSIIYISHNMGEILKLADRVTILKDGYRRCTERIGDLDEYRLYQLTYSFAANKNEIEQDKTKFILIKQYTENIVQDLPLGFIMLDSELKIQLINYSALEILNINKSVNNNFIIQIFKDINEQVKSEIMLTISNGGRKIWEEVKINDDLIVRINIFPAYDDKRRKLGTNIIIQDISMDKYITDYFIQSEKMASVAEVAVGVAHEINNPLYIIQNYIELLKSDSISDDGKESIFKIEKELERIVKIIGSLLSFSRKKELPVKKVNISNLIDDVLILLNHKFLMKNIKLINNNVNDIFISGDENKLKQVFINLITNSIEAVLEGGIIKIELLVSDNKEFIEIAIVDNGYGIPDDIKGHIFDPFFSTKITKKNTGLGLSICQSIVHAHDGIITFISIPGKETGFTVQFRKL